MDFRVRRLLVFAVGRGYVMLIPMFSTVLLVPVARVTG